jgi:HB1, ASXL, restriction endonuclease HTH domain
MTYLEAAITVLKTSRHPLATSEIMAEITRRGLIPTTGQTPTRTLSAELYRNLGKHPRLRREAKQGGSGAARGSVRWYLVTQ